MSEIATVFFFVFRVQYSNINQQSLGPGPHNASSLLTLASMGLELPKPKYYFLLVS